MDKSPVNSDTPRAKDPQRKCSNCSWFIKKADPHQLCTLCRPCVRDSPCPLEHLWTEEDWGSFETRRTYLLEKRAISLGNLKKSASKAPHTPDGGQREKNPTSRPGIRESFSLGAPPPARNFSQTEPTGVKRHLHGGGLAASPLPSGP